MDAGRELDALVARVLGYTVGMYDGANERGFYRLVDPQGIPGMYLCEQEEWAWKTGPSFSTDIKAAWQVVDHMAGQGYGLTIRQLFKTTVIFNDLFGHRGEAEEEDTVPVAICKAALDALST